MKILVIYLLLTTVWNSASSAEWKAVENGAKIPWDLETSPFEIRTGSVQGKHGNYFQLDLFESESNSLIGYISLIFMEPIMYTIMCMENTRKFNLPSYDQELEWTIAKTSSVFTISVNGTQVLLFEFSISSKCQAAWGGDVVDYVKFNSDDDVSKFYKSGAAPVEPGIYSITLAMVAKTRVWKVHSSSSSFFLFLSGMDMWSNICASQIYEYGMSTDQ
eukprot:sb/3469938/